MATYYIKNKGKGLNAVKSCCAENSSTLQRVKELFLLTLTPFSEKLYTNKEKSDTNFQSNKSSDNFIPANVQKMTVVMHSILCQKCKQNTFSSLIPLQNGHSLELHHISSATE